MKIFLKRWLGRVRRFLLTPIEEGTIPDRGLATGQVVLRMLYGQEARRGAVLGFEEVGFQVFSQTDEDGILLWIFSVIGSGGRRSVEVCAGTGYECNTANLIVHHGWNGLLIDGNHELVAKGREFYERNPQTAIWPPKFVCEWVTRDNINEILERNGFAGNIDLLSLDLDGVDYWIWEALTVVKPRVVVLEYNDICGPGRSVTVPYADDFDYSRYPKPCGMPGFCGASLQAFVKLAARTGYRLVGCNRHGFNAFFVREGEGEAQLPEVSVESCFRHPKTAWGMSERWAGVSGLPWVEV